MSISLVSPAINLERTVFPGSMDKLQSLLVRCSLTNLFIVALMGVVLRAFPFLSSFSLDYKNMLHGHSHFAFGGWVMPALFGLILKNFPQLEQRVAFRHWRTIALLILLSAYGMLVTFPLMGYKLLSVFFSTLSIAASFYLAFVIWKALPALKPSASLKFLNAGLFYMVFSSIGPLATGPLIAMGKTGTPLYFDVIYFYLHFQYNGWFLFALLALFYQYIEKKGINTNGKKVFLLLNLSCIPTYFLSVLWHQPSIVFNIIGGLAALIQCFALVYLIKDARLMKLGNRLVKFLLSLSLASIVAKIILQFFSAWPSLAAMAYQQRNFVIAYLHLVLLGGISLFIIAWNFRSYFVATTRLVRAGIIIFIAAFVCTEFLLIALPLSSILNFHLPHYSLLMLFFSMLLPIGIGLFGWSFISGRNVFSTAV